MTSPAPMHTLTALEFVTALEGTPVALYETPPLREDRPPGVLCVVGSGLVDAGTVMVWDDGFVLCARDVYCALGGQTT